MQNERQLPNDTDNCVLRVKQLDELSSTRMDVLDLDENQLTPTMDVDCCSSGISSTLGVE